MRLEYENIQEKKNDQDLKLNHQENDEPYTFVPQLL